MNTHLFRTRAWMDMDSLAVEVQKIVSLGRLQTHTPLEDMSIAGQKHGLLTIRLCTGKTELLPSLVNVVGTDMCICMK